jgi:hypothetical protein
MELETIVRNNQYKNIHITRRPKRKIPKIEILPGRNEHKNGPHLHAQDEK